MNLCLGNFGVHRKCDCSRARAKVDRYRVSELARAKFIDSDLHNRFGFWSRHKNASANRELQLPEVGKPCDVLQWLARESASTELSKSLGLVFVQGETGLHGGLHLAATEVQNVSRN